ncbi:MAG: biphenyl 2,3-dioxygenase [Candidatus Puniceispirillum sp. TMED52]|nr:biphenyl 2,3-dioxygenase [SAR116 cluster bacterium]OUU43752.1 MAG: biphenyl 2,3-dioxygenase [Candidatus Puniceispirillum sp. TMED52]
MFKTLKNALVAAVPVSLISAMPAFADVNLKSDDYVGISFWLISMALIAATAFFWLEISRVSAKWKTSLVVSGMVTMVAAVHYFYMRDVWVLTGTTPTVYRYIDWLITVPLLMIEFYLILSAITKVSSGIFWRLMIGTLVMLIGGYIGESSFTDENARIFGDATITIGFVIGMLGWAYILYEIFAGEAGQLSAEKAPESVQSAFSTMRWIVTIGWAIYPLGYFFGYMVSDTPDFDSLNIIYNLADVLNKIAFGVIIWSVATTESDKA